MRYVFLVSIYEMFNSKNQLLLLLHLIYTHTQREYLYLLLLCSLCIDIHLLFSFGDLEHALCCTKIAFLGG